MVLHHMYLRVFLISLIYIFINSFIIHSVKIHSEPAISQILAQLTQATLKEELGMPQVFKTMQPNQDFGSEYL